MPIANLLTYKNRDPVLDRKASQADPLLTNSLGLKWGEVIFQGASLIEILWSNLTLEQNNSWI